MGPAGPDAAILLRNARVHVMKRTSSRLVQGEVEGITSPEEHLKRMRGERGSGPGRDAVGSADSDLPRPP
jgi:hypothetical protein